MTENCRPLSSFVCISLLRARWFHKSVTSRVKLWSYQKLMLRTMLKWRRMAILPQLVSYWRLAFWYWCDNYDTKMRFWKSDNIFCYYWLLCKPSNIGLRIISFCLLIYEQRRSQKRPFPHSNGTLSFTSEIHASIRTYQRPSMHHLPRLVSIRTYHCRLWAYILPVLHLYLHQKF